MALITLRDPYESVRGKVNGDANGAVLFPKNQRQFRRAWVQPANPQTSMQDLLRSYFAAASVAFSSLTVSQAAAWAAASALPENLAQDANGTLYDRTAKGLYVGVNYNRQLDAQAISNTVPTDTKCIPISSVDSMTLGGTNWGIVISYPAELNHGQFIVMLSDALPGTSRKARATDCNIPTTAPANSVFAITGTSPQTLVISQANMRAPYASLAGGNRIGILIHTINDGYVLNQTFLEASVTLASD